MQNSYCLQLWGNYQYQKMYILNFTIYDSYFITEPGRKKTQNFFQ